MHLTETIIQSALDLNPQDKMLIIGSLMNSMGRDEKSDKFWQNKYEQKDYDYEVGIVKSSNFKEVY